MFLSRRRLDEELGRHCFGREGSRVGRIAQLLGIRNRGGEPEGGVRIRRGLSAEEREKSEGESSRGRRANFFLRGRRWGDEKGEPLSLITGEGRSDRGRRRRGLMGVRNGLGGMGGEEEWEGGVRGRETVGCGDGRSVIQG